MDVCMLLYFVFATISTLVRWQRRRGFGGSLVSVPAHVWPAGWSVLGQALGWQFQLGAAAVWLAGEVEKTQSCEFLCALQDCVSLLGL